MHRLIISRAFFGTLLICAALSSQSLAQDTDTEIVTVSADRRALIGTATTSSQGIIGADEVALLPAYRPGQLLETVPGLVVTAHSGEGKANQYLLRGFNLDHGTDIGVSIDGMPANEASHAHGQGYTDLNFLIPETVAGMDFTKGPYFAAQGDFSSVGSVQLKLPSMLDDQVKVTAGDEGFARVYAGTSRVVGDAILLGALEAQHYDGPWVHGDDQRKINAMLRYIAGDSANGFSATGMYYRGLWNATTDQPVRAITAGLIDRFGTLDPSDGGEAQRMSLSGQYHTDLGAGHLDANLYAINNRLTLWNNFTHYLGDPLNGDQEAQTEARGTFGGGAHYDAQLIWLGIEHDLTAGASVRYDQNHVYRDFTVKRVVLGPAEDDHLHLLDASAWVQATSHWTPWLRTVLGLRNDSISGGSLGSNSGHAAADMLQPKGSLIVTPFEKLEVYVSGGEGFHSDDLRGVNQAANLGIPGAPLIARQSGAEVGLRSEILGNLTATLTGFYLKSQSETTYDPDAGQDGAGPGSKRYGIEFNTTWQATSWLEFYTSFAASHAGYTAPSDDGSGGHVGTHIPNAPNMIGSLAAYLKNMGPWSGGLEFRYLGAFPVVPDNSVKTPGYSEWNVDGAYSVTNDWKIGLGIYNLFDKTADAAAFYYTDRLPGEPAAGVSDLHVHPLEPRSFRVTLTRKFE